MSRQWIGMIDFLALVGLLVVALLVGSCDSRSEEQARRDGVSDEIARMNEQDFDKPGDVVDAYQKARNAKDAGRVTELVVKRIADEGEEAVSEGWQEIKTTRFEVIDVETRSDDEAWVIGKYKVDYADGTVREEKFWVFPVYKENGTWKVDPDGAKAATDKWLAERNKQPAEN